MKLRFTFPAMPAASLAVILAVVPAVAQNPKSDFADTTTQSTPYTGSVVEEIVARVNDQVINLSDYERAEQELDQEAQQQSWSQQELYEQRRDLLRGLIDKQLLLSKGKELGITGETELVQRLDAIRKQNHMDSMEALQKAVEAQGISWEDFREQIRENSITQAVIGQQVSQHIDIAPSEIQDYYNAHRQEFQRPEQVALSEILIPTPNPDDAAQVAQAEKKADDIEKQLKSGSSFADLAKQDSGGPTAQQGGVLGEYRKGQLPKVMEDATFVLQPGGITQPIRTRQGWLILEVTQHQAAGIAPLSAVQGQIQQDIGLQKMEPALRAYLTQLREQAYIDIRPGYVDSGASPNEQKFIQSAYVPPAPKKKKHVERTRFRPRPRRQQKQVAAAVPAGVPTLDQVNHSGSSKEVAESGTQKPGKREKIRFGQAPRETLPAGPTRTVDAGAGPAPEQQVAVNGSGMANIDNGPGDVGTEVQPKRTKARLTDELKDKKEKRKQEEQAKKHKWVAPTPPPGELAKEKRESAALGLRGDTTRTKKVNPAKAGPKRRLSDEDRKKQKESASGTTPGQTTPAQGSAGQTPAGQSTPSQGTTPPQS